MRDERAKYYSQKIECCGIADPLSVILKGKHVDFKDKNALRHLFSTVRYRELIQHWETNLFEKKDGMRNLRAKTLVHTAIVAVFFFGDMAYLAT